ncbi:Uncharacterised protein [Mycobacteroides abscessus subsp. abscessus]|nr:Uncharacterised protein [Mycobacteroides abscessus subsp. abscessus]SIN07171.1 Uncharacterised protein [Mycobacteroides abscessus subsp. abscessus]
MTRHVEIIIYGFFVEVNNVSFTYPVRRSVTNLVILSGEHELHFVVRELFFDRLEHAVSPALHRFDLILELAIL